jgi:hypothetical protein
MEIPEVNFRTQIAEELSRTELIDRLCEYHERLKERITDEEIEKYIWENISIPLSQIDIDTQSDGYIQYLNAVYWAKWGRDNYNVLSF